MSATTAEVAATGPGPSPAGHRRALARVVVALLVTLSAHAAELLSHLVARDGAWPLPLAWPAAGLLVALGLLTRPGRAPGGAGPEPADIRRAAAAALLLVPALVACRAVLVPLERQPGEVPAVAAALLAALACLLLPARVAALRPPRLAGVDPHRAAALLTTTAAVLTVGVWWVFTRTNRFVGHDEAVYAAMSRAYVSDLVPSGTRPSRPVGVPALGALVLAPFGDAGDPGAADAQLARLRLLGLVLVLAALAGMYLLGRAVTTPARAATAVLVVVGASSVQRRIPELMIDLPAAGLLCGVLLLVLRHLRSGRVAPLLGAAALAAVTFYVRYGALAGLLAILVGALVAAGPGWWWRRRAAVAGAAAVALVGLLPHLVWSQGRTGSPLGVILASEESATRAFLGEGLLTYLVWAPLRLAGDLGGVLLLVAAVGVPAVALRAARWGAGDDERRWVLLLGVTAAVQTVALGIQAQPEERFLFFPIMLGAIIGVHCAARWAGAHSRAVVAGLAVVALLHVPAAAGFQQARLADAAEARSAVAAAGRLAGPPPCLVLGPRLGPAPDPELGWYSGCSVRAYTAVRRLPRATTVVLTRYVDDERRDPRVEAAITRLRAGRPARPVIVRGDGATTLEVLRIDPPARAPAPVPG